MSNAFDATGMGSFNGPEGKRYLVACSKCPFAAELEIPFNDHALSNDNRCPDCDEPTLGEACTVLAQNEPWTDELPCGLPLPCIKHAKVPTL